MTVGDLGGQALAAGLVDEIAMDVAPVVLGEGCAFSTVTSAPSSSTIPTRWSGQPRAAPALHSPD